MKYKITVNKITHEVEIENINERPVIAFVDGDRFEVMPEYGNQPEALTENDEIKNKAVKKPSTSNQPLGVSRSPHLALSGDTQTAPLPGTVIEIFVKAGEKVEAGQVILVIEAMKMKNSIRSVYSGTISEVLVSTGQSVAHKQGLIKFAEIGEAAWI
jgi:biotin carboxyl carrier protein